jgi:hypothetical protein
MTVSSETRPIGAALPQFVGTDMDDILRLHQPIEECGLRILAVQLGQ